MNKVFLIGNLTKDPDVRTTGSGTSVCTFRIAVQRRFANQQGEREAIFSTSWHGGSLRISAAGILLKGARLRSWASCRTAAMTPRTAQSGM